MYQRLGKAAYKADLSNTWALAEYLNHPERGFKSVHVAGTNGKGSTSHMLASILQEAGFKVGLYTSPHLKDFRERIRINGEMIKRSDVTSFVNKHKQFFEEHSLSFFEMTVGLAFDYFRNEKVDIAIIEVGMGGRLDSTNIISPEVSVITNIGLDHTKFLGDTHAKIAVEKAGIIKANVPVVIGETTDDTKLVFEETASDVNAPVYFAEEHDLPKIDLDLVGEYQIVNARTALEVVEQLKKLAWIISDDAIDKGMRNVISNTGLMGRWQQIGKSPKVICDTAHNAEGLKWIVDQLQKEEFRKLHVVFGGVKDKDYHMILSMLPEEAIYYFCAPDIERAISASVLHEIAESVGLNGEVFLSVEIAYKEALRIANEEDLIFVGGSTFVVAEVL